MKIKELFSGPEKWTKRTYAANGDGYAVSIDNPSAACFCLKGAIYRCYGEDRDMIVKITVAINAEITGWNDSPHRTFEEVKSLVEALDV